MDETLIENHNSIVGKQDTVYHHGDFAYKGTTSPAEYLKRLNGNIILVQGNHDPRGWGKDIIELRVNKQLIVMCHYPIEEWHGYFRGSIHTHCHTHKTELVSAKRRFNVGVDACNFKPVALEDLLKLV